MQFILACQRDQLVIGDAAPEKERQTRRQLQVADPPRTACGNARRLGFLAEHKFWVGEDALQRPFDPGIEISLLATLLVEPHKQLCILIGPWPAEGAADQRIYDLLRALGLFRRTGRMAHEDLPPAGRIRGAGRIEGAEDLKLAYMRIRSEERR